jgi:hypothetical protein
MSAVGRGEPHSPQKRKRGSFAVPQTGQVTANGCPHCPQNFRSGGFTVPQFEQVTWAV